MTEVADITALATRVVDRTPALPTLELVPVSLATPGGAPLAELAPLLSALRVPWRWHIVGAPQALRETLADPRLHPLAPQIVAVPCESQDPAVCLHAVGRSITQPCLMTLLTGDLAATADDLGAGWHLLHERHHCEVVKFQDERGQALAASIWRFAPGVRFSVADGRLDLFVLHMQAGKRHALAASESVTAVIRRGSDEAARLYRARRRVLALSGVTLKESVAALTLVHELRAAHPICDLTVLVRDDVAELFEAATGVQRVICYDPSRWAGDGRYREALCRALRAFEFDLAVATGGEESAQFADRCASAGERRADRAPERLDRIPRYEAETDKLFAQLGLTSEYVVFSCEPALLQSELAQVNAILHEVAKAGVPLVVIGSASAADPLTQTCRGVGASFVNLCGCASIGMQAELVRRSKLVVSSDDYVRFLAQAGARTHCLLGQEPARQSA